LGKLTWDSLTSPNSCFGVFSSSFGSCSFILTPHLILSRPPLFPQSSTHHIWHPQLAISTYLYDVYKFFFLFYIRTHLLFLTAFLNLHLM
jgi:hypothetical protein